MSLITPRRGQKPDRALFQGRFTWISFGAAIPCRAICHAARGEFVLRSNTHSLYGPAENGTSHRRDPAGGGFAGRSMRISGGGPKYFPPAWVCIRMLRKLGSRFRFSCGTWRARIGRGDEALARAYNVEFVNAEVVRQKHSIRILRGWELKAFALLHCRFREVLLLDSDNVPVANPEFLFETSQFKRTGAVFWPDVRFNNPRHVFGESLAWLIAPGENLRAAKSLSIRQNAGAAYGWLAGSTNI